MCGSGHANIALPVPVWHSRCHQSKHLKNERSSFAYRDKSSISCRSASGGMPKIKVSNKPLACPPAASKASEHRANCLAIKQDSHSWSVVGALPMLFSKTGSGQTYRKGTPCFNCADIYFGQRSIDSIDKSQGTTEFKHSCFARL